MGAILRAVGTYSPEQLLTNTDLEKILALSGQETSDAWIVQRTGIRNRRIAQDDETVGSMAVAAARNALNHLSEPISPIEHIVFATNTAERPFPNGAGYVQARLRESHPSLIDAQAAGTDSYSGCAGVNFALMYADALIRAGFFKTIGVVASEKLSSVTNYADRGTCILFGDGASFYLLSGNHPSAGFLGHFACGDGTQRELIRCEPQQDKVTPSEAFRVLRTGRAPLRTKGDVLLLEGPAVFKYVQAQWKELIRGFPSNRALNPHGLSFDDIDYVAPHLANLRNLSGIDDLHPGFLAKCGLSRDYNDDFCNSSTASPGKRVRTFMRESHSGQRLLMFGYGSGLQACAGLYEKP